MILLGCPLPHKKGHVIFLSTDIGGAITNTSNAQYTDVYSTSFPSGVTVAVPVDRFYNIWQSSLMVEEEEEVEFDFEEGSFH